MARGFTLMELLIALAIMALLFAIFVPGTANQTNHSQLVSTAHVIASALRLTRTRAIDTNRPKMFVVDVRNARYQMGDSSDAHALPSNIHVTLYTSKDAGLSATAGAIRFYPDGSSTGGGLTLDNGKEFYDVLVDWLTGGISIHEHPKANL